ncbi:MAG: hypothetical protein WKF71_19215 [Pyrinomonadaceae bacterium]
MVDVSGTAAQVLGESKKSLFALANGTARTEGEWQLTRIEGNLPARFERQFVSCLSRTKGNFRREDETSV